MPLLRRLFPQFGYVLRSNLRCLGFEARGDVIGKRCDFGAYSQADRAARDQTIPVGRSPDDDHRR